MKYFHPRFNKRKNRIGMYFIIAFYIRLWSISLFQTGCWSLCNCIHFVYNR